MTDQLVPKSRIRIDYYEGAYGPTLRIDTNRISDLEMIMSLFLDLAENKHKTIDFLSTTHATSTNVDQFRLRRISVENLREGLAREGKRGNKFVWSLSGPEWKRRAGLIAGLIQYNGPSHQYLTEEGVDDALVELAFCESA
jgi:hypothetical protein